MRYLTDIKGFRDPMKNVTNRTPAQRLGLFRAVGATTSGQNWRSARENMHTPESRPLWPGFNTRNADTKYETRRPVMVTHSGEQFRREIDAHHADGIRMDHTGWYADADCSRLLIAFVFCLPHGRFGAGYRDDDSGERVYYPCVFSDVRSATSFADSEAQYYAEQEKAYNERWQAAHDLQDEIAEGEKGIKRLWALRNHPDLGGDARDELTLDLAVLRNLRDKMKNDYSDIED